MTLDALAIAASTGLAIVFLASAILKLVDRSLLVEFLRALGVRGSLASLTALALALIELVVALGLLSVRFETLAWAATLGLSVAMLAALALGAVRRVSTPCGCFGAVDTASVRISLVRAASITILAGALLAYTVFAGVPRTTDPAVPFVGLPLGLLWLVAFQVLSRRSALGGIRMDLAASTRGRIDP